MLGKVYLIGAGPGDPELLTVKAQRLLQTAEIVLHDDLVSSEIRALIPASTRVWNVGKRCGGVGVSQEQIHELLISNAREGRVVARLKGGDPLVFGRAGEEIDALSRAGIDFEIVPGITAALGAALARISLTDRRKASRLLFLSNHRCAENWLSDGIDIVSSNTTIVIYMPGTAYQGLKEKLLAVGLDLHTPCLMVSCATSQRQQIYLDYGGRSTGRSRSYFTRIDDYRRCGRAAVSRRKRDACAARELDVASL